MRSGDKRSGLPMSFLWGAPSEKLTHFKPGGTGRSRDVSLFAPLPLISWFYFFCAGPSAALALARQVNNKREALQTAFCQRQRSPDVPLLQRSPACVSLRLDSPSTPRANHRPSDVFAFSGESIKMTRFYNRTCDPQPLRKLSGSPAVSKVSGFKRAASDVEQPPPKRPTVDDSFLGHLHVAAPRQSVSAPDTVVSSPDVAVESPLAGSAALTALGLLQQTARPVSRGAAGINHGYMRAISCSGLSSTPLSLSPSSAASRTKG